jgi:hypothetical protein
MAISAGTEMAPTEGRTWRASHWPLLSWPLIAALVTLIRPLSDRMALLNDPDTYLHIAAGRWMIDHLALPFHDPFSHSLAGAKWIPHEWLAEVVLAASYRALGWSGVVLLAMLCFAIAMALLTRRLLRHFEPFSGLILAGLSSVLLLQHLLARPHILALPLLVAWPAALFAAREQGRVPSLLVLPLMTLWANLHGSFMVGLALTGFVAAEAVLTTPGPARWTSLKRWAGFALLAALAALATPNGIDGVLLPFRFMAMPTLQSSFSEWLSPNFQTFQPLEVWLLGAIFIGFALGLRLPLLRLLLLLGLFHLALAHGRHADFVAIIAPLAVAASLGPQLAARIYPTGPSPLSQRLIALTRPSNPLGIALGAALFLAIAAFMLLRPIERADSFVTPEDALATARRLGLSGPVLNSETFGGYLIFSGVPTFIDGRIEMYGDAFLARYVAIEYGDAATLEDVLDRYHIAWTLLDPRDRAAAVTTTLPGWRRVYEGPYAVIDVRAAALPLDLEE